MKDELFIAISDDGETAFKFYMRSADIAAGMTPHIKALGILKLSVSPADEYAELVEDHPDQFPPVEDIHERYLI